jgi:hypothetical protein
MVFFPQSVSLLWAMMTDREPERVPQDCILLQMQFAVQTPLNLVWNLPSSADEKKKMIECG